MPKFTFTSPEGKNYTVEGPEGATQEQAFGVLQQQLAGGTAREEPPAESILAGYQRKLEEANPLERFDKTLTRAIGGPAHAMARGSAGAIVGGIEGLAAGAGAGAAALVHGEGLSKAREAFVEEAAGRIEKRGQQFARTPQSQTEATATQVVSKPFDLLRQGAEKAGGYVADKTGSPALGATVDTAIQYATGYGVGKGLSKVGKAGRGTAPPGPPTPPPGMSATGSPRGPMSDLGGGDVPRGTPPPGSPGGAPGAAQGPLPASTPPPPGPARTGGTPGGPQGGPAPRPTTSIDPQQTEAAKAYASRIGLDWARLGPGTRATLETIARDATALERLDPAAVERQALLERQRIPIPATRAQLTLDTVDARREAIAARTSEGGRIRDVDARANAAIQGNLEALRGRVGGLRGGLHEPAAGAPASIRAETPPKSKVGEAFQGALRQKAKWSRKVYEGLYDIAEKTEPDAKASTQPITDLFAENPDVQHQQWVQSWFNKARGAYAKKQGIAPEDVDLSQLTLRELYDLRKLATKNQAIGGDKGFYAGELKKAVDQAMQDVPEGANAWKAATDAFRRHQEEFKDQAAVRKLVGNKKGGDRITGLSKTWSQVAKGELEDIRKIKRSALTGGTSETRMAGRQAWRQIRAETVNRILDDARHVVATDETERNILTAAALNKNIKAIPRENLEEILGKRNTDQLYDLLRARKITKGRTTESGTVPNLLVLVERIVGHVPAVGHLARGAVSGVHKLHELGKAGRDVDRAVETPLAEAARKANATPAARAQRRRQLYQDIESSGPTLEDVPPQ